MLVTSDTTLLDGLPTPVVLVEPGSGRVLAANRAARELTGEDPVGRTAAEWLPVDRCHDADGRPLAEERLPAVRAARGERLRGAIVTCDTPRGARTLRVSAETLPGSNGSPVAMVTCEDVTELRAAQLGERLVADDLRAILEGIADAVTAPGAGRLARLRQRRRGAGARLLLRRGAAAGATERDHGPLGAADADGRAALADDLARPPGADGRGARPDARAVPRARRRGDALVAHQGQAGARGRRQRAARHQRDRGRHRAQAGRAGPALPRRGEPRARRLTRLRGDARGDREARGAGRGGLVRRRPRHRRRRHPARGGRARRPREGRARPRARRALPGRAAQRPRHLPGAGHRRVAAVAVDPRRRC